MNRTLKTRQNTTYGCRRSDRSAAHPQRNRTRQRTNNAVPSIAARSDWRLWVSKTNGRNSTVTIASGARAGESTIDGTNADPPSDVRLWTSVSVESTPPLVSIPESCRNRSVRTTSTTARTATIDDRASLHDRSELPQLGLALPGDHGGRERDGDQRGDVRTHHAGEPEARRRR